MLFSLSAEVYIPQVSEVEIIERYVHKRGGQDIIIDYKTIDKLVYPNEEEAHCACGHNHKSHVWYRIIRRGPDGKIIRETWFRDKCYKN